MSWCNSPELRKLSATISSTLDRYYQNDNRKYKWPYAAFNAIYSSVTDLKISADKVLFGRTAGENLSDKFHIKAYMPDCVVSYPQCEVLYDYEDKGKPLTLDGWVKSGAMFQPILIMFDTIPEESYDSITFSAEATISDGRVLPGSLEVQFGEYRR